MQLLIIEFTVKTEIKAGEGETNPRKESCCVISVERFSLSSAKSCKHEKTSFRFPSKCRECASSQCFFRNIVSVVKTFLWHFSSYFV